MFPFALRQLFGELFKGPAPTSLHSVMSDLSVALVFSQRVVLSLSTTKGFAVSGQGSARYRYFAWMT
jgi:hypothetical protein